MSLFASEKTNKIYFDGKGISKKTTKDWVEVLEELPLELKEEYMKLMPKEVKMDRAGTVIMQLNASMIPYAFLSKVIKSWSEDVPVTIDNLKKLNSKLLDALLNEITERYGLNAAQV
jgi:hypothetical protein